MAPYVADTEGLGKQKKKKKKDGYVPLSSRYCGDNCRSEPSARSLPSWSTLNAKLMLPGTRRSACWPMLLRKISPLCSFYFLPDARAFGAEWKDVARDDQSLYEAFLEGTSDSGWSTLHQGDEVFIRLRRMSR